MKISPGSDLTQAPRTIDELPSEVVELANIVKSSFGEDSSIALTSCHQLSQMLDQICWHIPMSDSSCSGRPWSPEVARNQRAYAKESNLRLLHGLLCLPFDFDRKATRGLLHDLILEMNQTDPPECHLSRYFREVRFNSRINLFELGIDHILDQLRANTIYTVLIGTDTRDTREGYDPYSGESIDDQFIRYLATDRGSGDKDIEIITRMRAKLEVLRKRDDIKKRFDPYV